MAYEAFNDIKENNEKIDLNEFKEKAYIAELENKILRMEMEKRDLERENLQLIKENEILKRELDRLRVPPLIIGTVIEEVSDRKVIVKSSTGPHFLVNVSQFVNPEDLMPGTRVCLNQQTLSVVDILPKEKDIRAMAMEVDERPSVSFSDIGGLSKQIQEIKEVVELPLKNPELFEKVGIEPPK